MSSFEEDVELMMLWACWRKVKKKKLKRKEKCGLEIFLGKGRRRANTIIYYRRCVQMIENFISGNISFSRKHDKIF